MKSVVIGFLGKAGSGKTTAANYLIEKYGAERVSFAGPLKEMAKQIWEFTDDQVYGDATFKEQVDPRWGISPRTAMQRLGESARQCISPTVWINACIEKVVQRTFEGKHFFVIDDVRYVNEVQSLNEATKFDGIVVRLSCTDSVSEDAGIHPSEAEMDWVTDKEVYCQIVSHRTPGSVHLLEQIDLLMASLAQKGITG